jgi:hypothetical protein
MRRRSARLRALQVGALFYLGAPDNVSRMYPRSTAIVSTGRPVAPAESFGVGTRGRLYDELGATRDVIQNHLFQVVGCLAMEPRRGAAEALRNEQVRSSDRCGR